MPFRFRKSVKLLPGVHVNFGKRGYTSTRIGRTTFRKGHTPRFSLPLFVGLSWFFGGRRRR